MYGLFVEHGPFIITKDHRVLKRELAWTNDYHLLYIDQPAYTGFRYVCTVLGCNYTYVNLALPFLLMV